jgi:sulfur-carrier protein adenylyltransferase/sulfurtransferase
MLLKLLRLLTPKMENRYARHLVLPQVGARGQERLKAASVLCVGAGGLGCPALLYLTAAGVGHIGIVEDDTVSLSNLQRQILYKTDEVGTPKATQAAQHLHALNPEVRIETHGVRLVAANALEILSGYDIILDGSDNFSTRYLLNDACLLLSKPLVQGAINRFEGQVSVFCGDNNPCYRCLFPEPPASGTIPNCSEAGVLGVLPGIIGSIQANEAIKIILDIGETLKGRFLLFDALSMQFREIKITKQPNCLCQDKTKIKLIDLEEHCDISNSKQGNSNHMIQEVTVQDLKAKQDDGEEFVLIDVREPDERAESHIPGSMHIPLGELPARLGELDPDAQIILQCHAGGRSAKATQFLMQQGFSDVANLTGGISAWHEAFGK